MASNDKVEENDLWGSDLYPERKRGPPSMKNFMDRFVYNDYKEPLYRDTCESRVFDCIHSSPIVKLLIRAMKNTGCIVDIRRHISCEPCVPGIISGYDPVLNQIIVCTNTARRKIESVVAHEMIHMFDYCRNEFDHKNLDHMVCTEIRAVSLFNCSFMTAFWNGWASIFKPAETHKECVKNIVLQTMVIARGVPKKDVIMAIDRVFSRCYNDLEPVGRRIRRNSEDTSRAYHEGPLYGYD